MDGNGYSMHNLAGLQSISNDLYEAAEIDGTTVYQNSNILPSRCYNNNQCEHYAYIIGSLQSFQSFCLPPGQEYSKPDTFGKSCVLCFNINAGQYAAMRQGYGATWAMVLFVFIFIATLIYQLLKG